MAESFETIERFESLFTTRTGLTLLIKKHPFFDEVSKEGFFFFRDAKDPALVWLSSHTKKVLLKGLKKELLETSITKGFIMFYETNKKDEVIRNTICHYKS